ncbi:MAG TPA: hypothetical protein VNM92_18520 [Thermoanaerobaculia bacterium]|nr:hypothetical protein [Thermoanaerobaculia bacterium]
MMKVRLILFAAPVLLTFCTSSLVRQDAPAPVPDVVTQEKPVPAATSPDWRTKVTAAKALDDQTQKREAMLALVREALSSREVQLSGDLHPDQVHPDDNKPAPLINFDSRLNQKSSAQSRAGTSTRSLQNNFGYYFSFRSTGYVVLGPAALDPRSPLLTRLAAEHEMFHAMNHVGDPRSNPDRELETWSQMFVRFFHDVYQFRQHWRPMLSYYDEASAVEQKAAIDRLSAYYRDPSSATVQGDAVPKVRAAFEEWLVARRKDMSSSRLVNDLENAIAGTPAGS